MSQKGTATTEANTTEVNTTEMNTTEMNTTKMNATDVSTDVHAAWLEGVACFNRTDYWDAHEAWEAIWLPASGERKHFYGGLILLAAALHKARYMGNARGGRRNYAKALTHLALIDTGFHGVNVRALEAEVHAALCDGHSCPQLPTSVTAQP